VAAAAVLSAAAAAAQPQARADGPKTCARLYAFTGLGGQVPGYSLGVFAEADKIAEAHPCVKIYKRAWSDKTRSYATAKANHQIDRLPIFLIGHSMGADAALAIARRLANDNIPVETVFSYDPTRTQAGCVPANVRTFINWRGVLLLNLGRGNPQPCPGNRATAMQDYPLQVRHIFIDDLPTVHALTTKHVGEVLHMIEEMKGGK
jgi:hypothetical protein